MIVMTSRLPNRTTPMPRLFGLVLLAAMALGTAAGAQEAQRIVAVVNDDVISNSDLANRVKLTILSSNLPDGPQTRERIAPQILRTLVDERLQLQEGARLSVGVQESEIDDALGRIEQNNKMQRGGLVQLLRQAGIPRSALEAQVRATLVWQRIVQRRLRPTLDVGDDEIEEVLQRFRTTQGVTQNLLAEIFLAVDTPEQDEEVKQTAQGLIDQIKKGTPFPALAQQFSQSASAAAAGDIGWVQQRDDDDEISRVIAQLQPGEISPPIRSVAGYYIYALRDRRKLSAPAAEEAVVSLSQLVIPLRPQAAAAEVEAQIGLANTVRDIVSGCADFARVAEELGAPTPTQLEKLRVADLSPALRPLVAKLKVGEASEPTRLNNGVMMVMLCIRQEAKSNLPTRDDVAENLMRERLDLAARRYLRDLRRVATVDLRN